MLLSPHVSKCSSAGRPLAVHQTFHSSPLLCLWFLCLFMSFFLHIEKDMHHVHQAVGYVGDRMVSAHVQLTFCIDNRFWLFVACWKVIRWKWFAEMCHVDLRADMHSEDDLTPTRKMWSEWVCLSTPFRIRTGMKPFFFWMGNVASES